MPNVRAKGKVFYGGYVDEHVIRDIDALARRKRVTRSELVVELMVKAVKRGKRAKA